jgi:Co/Zn/Cd efflux system component
MVIGSLERLISPQAIQYEEALAVGVLGLLVNMVCALILGKAHQHDHAQHGHHEHHAHHHDLNLKSAYLHVVADAVTSVLAIVALLADGSTAGRGWTR